MFVCARGRAKGFFFLLAAQPTDEPILIAVEPDRGAPPSPSVAVGPDPKAAAATQPYIHPGNPSDDFLDIFDMTGNFGGVGSPSPYIKDEPDDRLFGSPHSQRFAHSTSVSTGHGPSQTTAPGTFNLAERPALAQFSHSHGSDGSIDPAELTMQGNSLSTQNGVFTPSFPSFHAQPGLSSYNLGHSGIADEELLDLGNLDDQDSLFGSVNGQARNVGGGAGGGAQDRSHAMAMNMGPAAAATSMNQIYSPQLDGSSAPSAFAHTGITYEQFSPPPAPYSQSMNAPSPFDASPRPLPNTLGGGVASVASLDHRRHMQALARARAQRGFDQHQHQHQQRNGGPQSMRNPMPGRPATSIGAAGLTLTMPQDSGSYPQPISHAQHHLAQAQARHRRNVSSQWDAGIDSPHSFADSPLSSPGGQMSHHQQQQQQQHQQQQQQHHNHHLQISDVLKSGKPASLPAKVDVGVASVVVGSGSGSGSNFQTQEAKRRRRRESHNLVERRRRDNINERIHELSHLVPQHRLEDERVRKHLLNNSPLSPGLGALGVSPPQATSLLAGGAGRRAAGALTSIPAEEKDKGPNKGDILNGSVSWMRDLMWALHAKLQQESELVEYITSLGGSFPFETTEEDRRMRTELLDAMERNDAGTFSYSRAPGTGLRVPKHTNLAGEPNGPGNAAMINNNNNNNNSSSMSPPRPLSSNSLDHTSASYGPAQSSGGSGHDSIGFKEEDEYNMDMT